MSRNPSKKVTIASLFDDPNDPDSQPDQQPVISPEKQARQRTKCLLYDKLFYDVIFEVQGEEVHAHRAILASASEYFFNMFTNGTQGGQNAKIKVEGAQPKTFKAMIEYIYLEKLPKEQGLIKDLLMISEEYQLKKLKEECEGRLIGRLRKQDNLVEMLLVADEVKAEKLKKKCMELLLQKIPPRDICKSADLNELPRNILLEMLQFSLSA